MSTEDVLKSDLVQLTADIVAAYVSKNPMQPADIPGLIGDIHEALARASGRASTTAREELKPAVAVKKSVTPDQLACLECGQKFKSLKRHLRTHHNLAPEEYKEKWGLAHDYPMVAETYAAERSQLAKKMGLGTRRE
jgi:predicted transcriptional regulator